MLVDQENDREDAQRLAEEFAKYINFGSHGERVGRKKVRELGVRVTDLENNDDLQDADLSIRHATVHTFSRTPGTKIIEHHHGKSFVQMSGSKSALTRGVVPQQFKSNSSTGKNKPRRGN